MVQSCHAAIEASKNLTEHPYLVLIQIKNENKLKKVGEELDKLGFQRYNFYEPDRNNELTSFAVGPIFGDDRLDFKRFCLVI